MRSATRDWNENEPTSDWKSTEPPLGLESAGFGNGRLWADDNRVKDETVLVALDLANHLGLLIGRAVVVNDTKTTKESHVDGHVVLSDGVHWGGDEWGLKGNALGDWSFKVDNVGREIW